MHAQDLIALLAARAGLPALKLSSDGTAALVIDDKLTLNLEHDEPAGRLLAYVPLGSLPVQDREAHAVRLLRANLFGRDTGGAVLALDGDELLLTRTLELEHTDDTRFIAALEALVEAAQVLHELPPAMPPEATEADLSPFPRLHA